MLTFCLCIELNLYYTGFEVGLLGHRIILLGLKVSMQRDDTNGWGQMPGLSLILLGYEIHIMSFGPSKDGTKAEAVGGFNIESCDMGTVLTVLHWSTTTDTC